MSPEVFEKVDEQATNSLLYSLSMGLYNFGNGFSAMGDLPMNDQLYIIQHKMIKRLAEEGPCVILGRCADYVLRDFDNVVNIFINADMEYRKERAIKYHNVDKRKVEQIINRTDKNRANYYSFYSGLKWGQPQNYDLCINSGRMTQENVVDIITNYVDMLENNIFKNSLLNRINYFIWKGGVVTMTEYIYMMANSQGDIDDFIFGDIEWHESQR